MKIRTMKAIAAMVAVGTLMSIVGSFAPWPQAKGGAPNPYPQISFVFGFGGDMGWNRSWEHGRDTLTMLANDKRDSFFLHLGDLSYNTTPNSEASWCDWIKSYVGPSYPYQLVAGNHEDNDAVLIDNFAKCLPDRLRSVGNYAKEYYFDYPLSAPLARFILLSPGLTFANGGVYSYAENNSHVQWTLGAIDSARAAGIPWIIVGVHMPCPTLGHRSWSKCYMSQELFSLLLAKQVDMIIAGDSHTYERSRQLSCGVRETFLKECVAGSGNNYKKGSGTVQVITGNAGTVLDAVSWLDGEAGYMEKAMGNNTENYGWGYSRVTVSATSLSLQTVFKSSTASLPWSDSFLISAH